MTAAINPGCDGKQKFRDRVTAETAAGHVNRGERCRVAIGVYRCVHCGTWHIGSSVGRRRVR